ncbi:hypothetical protein A3J90_06145 [candidate division WOR-1 bacterium RIFOXYC2_FULL_37_10]|uniref:Arginine biosynthesis bifunctional protein ArgJ n=1 Tax=candidate division WOR-1 bacterium RIFOXYB2_FULL_37_13 TaxID=1802579 RepID=A0A1F4SWJ1_UNCSA|nr:MAG: hypothetical protein A2246_02830 [candidate division WOR-1 bacterium RIFOXYA2_FULL_37_7]OGC24727.1 MAG: hypothetical protein A2310_04500 [candidate division WOR-1 bacterium RIFOXYB2_FULL_37_13]OGC34812.1 MAG: hypothetical protein A3J90_06145 [candidate division WOR-1 bacterium RIFOXYC2_FULL_37_10]
MKKTKGGITAPRGFKASGIACGIKKSGKKDLALVCSDVPAVAAGVFTTNQYKAAPIIVSEENIKSGLCQAVIANAGNANCGTGEQGILDARKTASSIAKALNIKSNHVLVTSTGKIGEVLPMSKIIHGMPLLVKKLSKNGSSSAADAIMTTDLRKKEIAVKVGDFFVGGIAKGSGMIHPNMATMHAFITTDALIDKKNLQSVLKRAVDISFNMTTVDQCMSTNDCVFILANGLSNIKIDNSNMREFSEAVEFVCKYLAREIARDGEGATKLITVKVTGARNEKEAKIAARAIAGSDLLKCAVYGNDNNPGRILAAVGATGAKINPEKITTSMKFLKKEAIIICDLGAGASESFAWGCDLTEGYIKINARYHT